MFKQIIYILAICLIVNASLLVDIRHQDKLLGSCKDIDDKRYYNISDVSFAKKYEFERISKWESIDQYMLNTNITGYTQKEYCGIGVQLCYNLNGDWHNFKTCNIY